MASTLNKTQFDTLMRQLKKDGQLTASKVIEIAKKPTSPLHKLFEWDDAKAADKYRKQQARNVIKLVNAQIEEPEDKVVHVPTTNKTEGSYKQVKVVVTTPSEFELAMDQALSKLRAAELAVKTLEDVAKSESPDSAAILAIALKGLSAASTALERIH